MLFIKFIRPDCCNIISINILKEIDKVFATTFMALPLNCPHLKGSNVNDIQRQWFTEGTPEKDWLQYMAHGRQ